MSTVTNGMALNAAAFSKPPANLNGFGHVTLPGEPHSVTLSSPMTGLSDEDDDDDVPLLVRITIPNSVRACNSPV